MSTDVPLATLPEPVRRAFAVKTAVNTHHRPVGLHEDFDAWMATYAASDDALMAAVRAAWEVSD